MKDAICNHCGMGQREDGQDPCIDSLPGVVYACCGHGGDGYVAFCDNTTLRFSGLHVERTCSPERRAQLCEASPTPANMASPVLKTPDGAEVTAYLSGAVLVVAWVSPDRKTMLVAEGNR